MTAHSLSVNAQTGQSEWHIDYELGDCTVTDSQGLAQTLYAAHRHPYGTEYAELFES